jgi:Probable lipoprotein LpqN
VKRFVAAVAMAALGPVACGPKSPDFQSVLSTTTSAAATTTTTTGKPTPLSEYLESIGVNGEPVPPGDVPDLTVSIPTPPGWGPHGDPKAHPNAVMLAKGDNFPAALLVVFKLRGTFDPAEAIQHANADMPEGFHQLNASTAPFNGFPSSMVEGSYDARSGRMHSWNRIVLPTGSTNQRYMVQLTITSMAGEAVKQSDDIEAIIRGFVVAKK